MKKQGSMLISAGEFSGDLLAADLALMLRERFPKYRFFGLTGPAMERAGVESIASINDAAVMGILDVLKALPTLARIEKAFLAHVDRVRPECAILVDYPGFHMRLAEQLRLRGITVFQYAAPKLWAWGAGRASALRRNVDLVLGILPFEQEFFVDHQVNYSYVGSPLLDRIGKVMVSRDQFGISEKSKVVAFLPGSRVSEWRNLLRMMVAIKQKLQELVPGLVCVVPIAESLEQPLVCELVKNAGMEISEADPKGPLASAHQHFLASGIHFVRGMNLEIMAMSDAAVVASGTATLECALLGTPLAVTYITDELTYAIAQRVVKIPYISLVNLMLGEACVREFIQDFSAENVVAEVVKLLEPGVYRGNMISKFNRMRNSLKGDAPLTAVERIYEYLEKST